MAKLALKKGATDVSVYVFAQDSSVTTGAGLTGLTFETASLTAYYVRPLGSATAITLATQTVTGAHSDGGFVEVDATNMPGIYRLDLPDAVCATGVPSVVVMLKGAANLAPVLLEIQLTDFDLNSTSNAVGSVTGAVGSVTGAVGSVTAGVILADNAITSEKYDGATAFPYVQADVFNPATLLSIPILGGYDVEDVYRLLIQMLTGEQPFSSDGVGLLIALSDITTTEPLPSLDDKLAAIQAAATDTSSIAGDVWSHATRTLTNQGVEATYPAGGDPLIIYRDTTVTISLTGLGDSTGDAGTKIFFTAKENLEDADTSSILQLVCTRADPITDPDTDDLLYINKAAPTAVTEGTFVFADHTDGTAVVTIAGAAAAYLPIYAATPLYWDVKMVTAAGVSTILSTGSMYIYGTPTRTIA